MLHEMELVRGGGGCCCAARAFPQAHEVGPSTDVQRIMLRFRPIAPRPAPPPQPGSGAPASSGQEEGQGGAACVEKGAKKRRRSAEDEAGVSRRAGRARTRRGPKPKRKAQAPLAAEAAAPSSTLTTSAATSEEEVAYVGPEAGAAATAMVAFPLVPETPTAAKEQPPPQFPTTELLQVTAEWWERPPVAPAAAAAGASHVIAPTPYRPVCSVVTVVESTAGEWEIAGGEEQQQGSAGWLVGRDEWEAKQRLGADARPALVSDPSGKVAWVNAAYSRMVGAPDHGEEKATTAAADEGCGVVGGGGVKTVLVAPAAALETDMPAFSCRVKVRWCGAGRGGRPVKGSITAPCDVWRLAGGSLAWRIDVIAALSLGPMAR